MIEGDWVYHHRFSVAIARRINEEGWSVWQLRPNGEYALHGITSVVYATIAPEPWTLIPLQAALHATSTLLLVYILQLFVSSWRVVVVAALSFLLFPTSLITYAQITKDGYSICGGFMFLYGWLLLARWPEGQNRRRLIKIAVLIAGGATVGWIARPYLVQIMMGLSALFAILVALRMIVLSIRRAVPPIQGVLASATAWLMVAILIPFNALGADMYLVDSAPRPPAAVSPSAAAVSPSADAARPSGEAARMSDKAPRRAGEAPHPSGEAARLSDKDSRRSGEAAPPSGEAARVFDKDPSPSDEAAPLSGKAARVSDKAASQAGGAGRVSDKGDRPSGEALLASRPADTPLALLAAPVRESRYIVPWNSAWWVPAVIDNRMYSLALLRYRWQGSVGRSTVDQDVMPASPTEVVAYLPRLITVGFMAPFPAHWFEQGAFKSTTMMRRTVGVEMVLTYVALVGLLLNVWRWRARLEFWFVLAYGGVTTLIWAFIVPNIGSMHRARFGFLMVLVALGIAGILSSPRFDWIARGGR